MADGYRDNLVQCQHCVSRVKANRMALHIIKAHKVVTGKQQCVLDVNHKVSDMDRHLKEECDGMAELKKNAYDGGGVTTVPSVPVYGVKIQENLNWDNANCPAYDPLENTNNKEIIRGAYAAGLPPAERKNVVYDERQRRTEIIGKNFSTEKPQTISNVNNFFSRSCTVPKGNGLPTNQACFAPNNGLPKSHTRIPSNFINGTKNDSDSSLSSTQSELNDISTNRSLNDNSTTESDGFTSVWSRKGKKVTTVQVPRGRGRGRINY